MYRGLGLKTSSCGPLCGAGGESSLVSRPASLPEFSRVSHHCSLHCRVAVAAVALQCAGSSYQTDMWPASGAHASNANSRGGVLLSPSCGLEVHNSRPSGRNKRHRLSANRHHLTNSRWHWKTTAVGCRASGGTSSTPVCFPTPGRAFTGARTSGWGQPTNRPTDQPKR